MAKMRFIEKISEAEKPGSKRIVIKSRLIKPLMIICILQSVVIAYLLLN